MITKILGLLSSIRFWQLTLAAASEILAMTNPDMANVLHVIAAWLVAVAGIGTIDKATKKK